MKSTTELNAILSGIAALTGVVNTVRSIVLNRSRIKIRFFPCLSEESTLAIEVINEGQVAATLDSIVFSTSKKAEFFLVDYSEKYQKETLPKLLTQGESFVFYVCPDSFDNPAWKTIQRPVARLANGRHISGPKIPDMLRIDPYKWLINEMGLAEKDKPDKSKK